ncbi:hypothetical protein ND856_13965 [Leptospira bandrabouensis]|uniref:hypothetical protein n=1 Tax=Leptospira bandrabouensis TaxID=2484903 RepID=UPI00223E1556|nr:hypothetical protein [Leptospira bandrabouensis]MCW7459586.1 hypothetical protein [Leptospira bandrabouensis]MCW7478396.1 hypothetical protein [Leptospira bandrabouensis]MCW7486321.1 hypothetical protein [Leptospira bandrabouensis]
MAECSQRERDFLDALYETGTLSSEGDSITIGDESLITEADVGIDLKKFWPR